MEWAVCDFQRGAGWRASNGDNSQQKKCEFSEKVEERLSYAGRREHASISGGLQADEANNGTTLQPKPDIRYETRYRRTKVIRASSPLCV